MTINIKNKGFTLIELLVVIAIIGILAALIIVALSGAQRRARDTQRKNNAKGIALALEQYAVDNSGSYPASATATAITATAGSCGAALSALTTNSAYLNSSASVCKDPQTQVASYITDTGGSKYLLAWGLENTNEQAKSSGSGNGTYAVTSGTVTENGLTSGALGTTTRAFVTYGPQ